MVCHSAVTFAMFRVTDFFRLPYWPSKFPVAKDDTVDHDYAEPRAPRAMAAYAREHAEIFDPIRRHFALIRVIATAVTHEVGAFG